MTAGNLVTLLYIACSQLPLLTPLCVVCCVLTTLSRVCTSRSSSVHSETGGTSVNTQRYGTATVVVASAGATGRAAEPASLLPSKGRGSRLSSAGGPLRTPPPLVLWCRRRARCVPSWLWPILGAIAILVAGVVFGVGVPVASRDPQPWGTISPIIGWTYFFAWSISFYPQGLLALLALLTFCLLGCPLTTLSLRVDMHQCT